MYKTIMIILSLALALLFSERSIASFGSDPCDEPVPFCPEDINQNGEIEINDVLQILLNWDVCGDGTFRPIGDINGDCCVDILDVLQIINRWDAACIPKGACCMSDGSGCLEDVNEVDCFEQNGIWHGEDSLCQDVDCPIVGACCFQDGSCADMFDSACIDILGAFQGLSSTCGSVLCPQPGASGDECNEAFFAFLGQNYFDTSAATPSSPDPDESQCLGTYLNWKESPDIWFVFVAHDSGWVHFTTCEVDSYDTSIVLYENSCDNQVSCNGDGTGDDDCQWYYSNLDYEVQAGSTYFIRIGGLGGQTGFGTLTIE